MGNTCVAQFFNKGADFSAIKIVARLMVVIYLLALPFSHNAAIKNISLYGILIIAIILFARKALVIDYKSPILRYFSLLFLVLFIASILGVSPLNSLSELRGYFLPALILLIVPSIFDNNNLLDILIAVVVIGFAVRTGLTFAEIIYYYPNVELGRTNGSFISGFSLLAHIYLPFFIGIIFLNNKWRFISVLFLAIIFLNLLISQSRAPAIAAVITVFVCLAALRQWKYFVYSALSSLIIVGGVFTASPVIFNRFESTVSLSNPNTKSLSGRTYIWDGVVEITADRPVLGYGVGWKKLGKIAVENGYVEKWLKEDGKGNSKEKSWYFSLPTDKVNPHNLYFHIYFESGILGLASYLFFMSVLLWQSVKLLRSDAWRTKVLSAMALCFLVGHLVANLANGLWLDAGPAFFIIALLEIARRDEAKRNTEKHAATLIAA